MPIVRLDVERYGVPLKRPVSLPTSQEPQAANRIDVVAVHLHTDKGPIGFGYTYGFGGGIVLESLLNETVGPAIVGLDPHRVESIFGAVQARLEGVGFAGLAARAYAAIDLALWDWKGKCAGLPLWAMLGGARSAVKPISADVATPALGLKASARECLAALDRGSAGIQIEVGTVDPDLDEERLRQLREAIPDGAWFEVNASGRYDFGTAAWLGSVGTEEFGLDGFADPLPLDDQNYRRLADRLDVGLSAGALADRPADLVALLHRGGIESLRLDPFRLGGLTPLRKIAAAAELNHVAITTVRAPQVGVHLGVAYRLGRMCEHVDWFDELFTGNPVLEKGQLKPSEAPGLGLAPNAEFAGRFRL